MEGFRQKYDGKGSHSSNGCGRQAISGWRVFSARAAGIGQGDAEKCGVIKQRSKTGTITKSGKAVVGTVKGDLHDIGKNLLVMALEGAVSRW
jgi:hypothetical protein